MKKVISLFVFILLFCCLVFAAEITATVNNLEPFEHTTEFGNLFTDLSATNLLECGFAWSDIVKVSFLDKELCMPLVANFFYVDAGKTALIALKDSENNPTGRVILAINIGDFTTTYGIAKKISNEDKSWYWVANEGVTFPLEFKIETHVPLGYMEEYDLHDLSYKYNRQDYPNLTDAQYANFRKVETSNMHNLYRTTHPANNQIGRSHFANAELQKNDIKVCINLSDYEELAKNRKEYKDSYYSTCKNIYLSMSVDFFASESQNKIAEGLRFIIANEGPYVIHCLEGKDRTGFVCAVLECLMGASAEEVEKDYMTTFYNFNGIEKGSKKYDAVLKSNIVKSIQRAFNIPNFYNADLSSCANAYLLRIGLTQQEINSLKERL